MPMQQALEGRRVLIVEDDHFIATRLKRRLTEVGVLAMGPAASVEAAQYLLDTEPEIDGAILDIRLGETLVYPIADELERSGVPFIFATGFELSELPDRFSRHVVLQKPLEDQSYISALEEIVRAQSIRPEVALRNGILSRLSSEGLLCLLPRLKLVKLYQGQVLELPSLPVSHVRFPLDCVASVIATGRNGTRVETGIIGCEGVTGSGLSDDDDRTPYELVIQIEGTALEIAAEDFRQFLGSVPELRGLISRFARALGVQVSFTALANARFDIRRRLARWLIMVDDRVPGRSFDLTHNYLAIMLGVRRPSVTDVLHILEGEKLIRSNRNRIEIRDREGLISAAGECYGSSEDEYDRLMSLKRFV